LRVGLTASSKSQRFTNQSRAMIARRASYCDATRIFANPARPAHRTVHNLKSTRAAMPVASDSNKSGSATSP
jgi:murein endopeptidase